MAGCSYISMYDSTIPTAVHGRWLWDVLQKNAKTHKWSLLLQGSFAVTIVFFSELWRSRVKRFGPLTISTLPDFCQMGWFTDQGNPFFVESFCFQRSCNWRICEDFESLFLVTVCLNRCLLNKAGILSSRRYSFLWVSLCQSYLLLSRQDLGNKPIRSMMMRFLCFWLTIATTKTYKDAAWFPLKKSSALKTDWIFNYSREISAC